MREPALKIDLAGGALVTAGLALALAGTSGWAGPTAIPDRSLLAALAIYALLATILAGQLGTRRPLGWANRITLIRAIITCVLAGALTRPERYAEQTLSIVALILAALALDGLDGWLARHRRESSDFGARFDMEVDAALILVLCAGLWLSGLAPAWVLAIGLMRPAFIAAGLAWPWLSRPLPESFRRKLVCVLQVGALPVAMLPFLSEALRLGLLAAALAALAVSFAIDIAWLFRQRHHSKHPEWRNT